MACSRQCRPETKHVHCTCCCVSTYWGNNGRQTHCVISRFVSAWPSRAVPGLCPGGRASSDCPSMLTTMTRRGQPIPDGALPPLAPAPGVPGLRPTCQPVGTRCSTRRAGLSSSLSAPSLSRSCAASAASTYTTWQARVFRFSSDFPCQWTCSSVGWWSADRDADAVKTSQLTDVEVVAEVCMALRAARASAVAVLLALAASLRLLRRASCLCAAAGCASPPVAFPCTARGHDSSCAGSANARSANKRIARGAAGAR